MNKKNRKLYCNLNFNHSLFFFSYRIYLIHIKCNYSALKMLAKLFEIHGRFCVSHPLEIIVTTLTLTACMLNLDTGNSVSKDERLPGASNCWNGRCNSDVSIYIYIYEIIN